MFTVCAETVDCYSGQICQGGRCIFSNSLYGNVKSNINNAPAISNYYSSSILPYGSYNRLNTLNGLKLIIFYCYNIRTLNEFN